MNFLIYMDAFFLCLLLFLPVFNKIAFEGYIGTVNFKCAAWQV